MPFAASASLERPQGKLRVWFSEKVSRLKLTHADAHGLGTFAALEFLALSIHGKQALWRARSEVASLQPRLNRVGFSRSIEPVRTQEQSVEQHRLAAARKTLANHKV